MASGFLSEFSRRISAIRNKKPVVVEEEEWRSKKKDIEIRVKVSEGRLIVHPSIPMESDFESLPICGGENNAGIFTSHPGMSPLFFSSFLLC